MEARKSGTMWVAAFAAVLALSLSACGGGGADVRSEVTTTTKGQQLMDLQKAHNSGVITKDEYERERRKILER